MNGKRLLVCIGIAAAAICTTASAQSTQASPDQPKAIGTSQKTADEANKVAIQRGDTATVVRTGPSVGDKVSNAADDTKAKVKATKKKVKPHPVDTTNPQ